ncbi:MAG: hypothetical protein GTN39_02990 [Candidatus Aenigmarchaeota archaeon]|nr:hypothetical protein [Candidatus Aenigmarchaeota archaeon]
MGHIIPEKAYLFGVMIGDGYLHCTENKSYQIALQAVDRDLISEFAKCLKKVYGLEASISNIKIKTQNWNDKWQARICCKEIFNDILGYGPFKTDSWKVPKIISDSSEKVQCRFLKGFFDSEGSVGTNSRRVVAVSTNKQGLNGIKSLLSRSGINSRIHRNKEIRGNRKPCYSIRITGRENILKYNEKIGFSIRRKQVKLDVITNNYKLYMKTHEEIKVLKPKMAKLRNEGMSYEKIARELNIGTATVWTYLNNKHKSRN